MPAAPRTHPGRSCPTVLGALVVALALVAGACSDDADDEAGDAASDDVTTTTVAAPDPDLAPPDEPGPYGVGRVTLDLVDPTTDRPLVTDVWYPTEADASGEASIYEFLPGISFPSDLALAGAPLAGDAPFPLVVYSHGSGGLRYVASYFTELLASHGFVVAAVDHSGNTAVESIAGTEPSNEQIAVDRLGDTTALITELLAIADEPAGDDPDRAVLAGSIDAERIGVAGHSFGAFTALGVASGFANEIGEVPADDRVDAVAAIAPATRFFSDDELAAIDVPTLLLSGTADETTPVDPNTERPWELVAGRPLWRVDLVDAGHQSFTDVCDYQELLPTLPDALPVLIDAVDEFAEEGCAEELMPIEQAHELSNSALVSFLSAYVAGEEGYEAFLAEVEPGEVVEVRD